MNSDGQVVLVHAIQNKQGQVGFFVESSDENTRKLGTSCVSKKGGKNNYNIIEYAKKCFNEYERAVESSTERLKKNPVLQMYYNNPPTAQSGLDTNEQARVANNMIFCRSPLENQVWYRFRSEGGSAFPDDASKRPKTPAEANYEHCPIHSGVQANVKEPLAYNLTFVPVSKRKKKKLPEIKVLVPTSDDELKKHRKKKRIPAKQGDEDKVKHDGEEKTKQDGEDKSRHSNEDKVKKDNDDEVKEDNENAAKQEEQKPTSRRSRRSRDRKKAEKNDDRKKTLQEYLKANRPDFIERADKRRQCLADLAILRDLRKQKYYELSELNRKLRLRNEVRERARTRTRSEARRWARTQRNRDSSSSTTCSSSY